MSQETIERRAAQVRRSWSQRERRHRAQASQRRCFDLLMRIASGLDCRGVAWSGKSPA